MSFQDLLFNFLPFTTITKTNADFSLIYRFWNFSVNLEFYKYNHVQ